MTRKSTLPFSPWRVPWLVVLGVCFLPGVSRAQRAEESAASELHPAIPDIMRWRSIGPYRGGRSVAVAGDPADQLTFYFGATGGGVWKTENAGITWENVSDGYVGTGSVGAIAVAESDPDVVYVGMGESCLRGNASYGDGVYRSTDGGRTWKHLGLEATRHVGRIRVHPGDPDLVYVAAVGDAFASSPDRGVFRSQDGGVTWEKILYRSDEAGAIDLAMNPNDPRTLYATLWEARRYPWSIRSGGPGSGIFKSTDGGDTWVEISGHPGLPPGIKGRIGIAVSPASPERVWAIVEARGKEETGVYRSDDGGRSWMLLNNDNDLTQRPWYYHHVFADPRDAGTVYVLNTELWKSTDGGSTFQQIRTPHGDNHDLWIDPDDPARMVEGNDGGATVSLNGGRNWSTLYNQPTAQMYHVTTDNGFPYRVYGAQQDNSTISVPSRSDDGSIAQSDWYAVGGSETGYIAVHPQDPNLVFAGDRHWITLYDHRIDKVRYVSVWPEFNQGWGARDLKYRFQWTFPIVISPQDPEVVYATSQYVHRSRDRGESWETISPDLTRADTTTLQRSPRLGDEDVFGDYWGPLTLDNTGVEWYATVFAFAESPVESGLLWAGSDDGLIHLSRDDGGTWTNVTPPELPEFTTVSIIEPSHRDPGVAYVAAHGYRLGDRTPYLLRTRDYGKSWDVITRGIPAEDFTRVVREDPSRAGLLYAGTETGVYVSFDDGGNWTSLRLNLPVVPIHDLAVHDNDLVAATHGRAFWILDDLTPLHEVAAAAVTGPVHLFAPRTAVRLTRGAGSGVRPVQSPPEARGENPPSGAVISYWLEGRAQDGATLTIRNARGDPVRTLDGLPAEPGGHRFVWNLRYPDPTEVQDAVFRLHFPQGPLAPPGTYHAELVANGQTYRKSFRVSKDPRIPATQSDLEEQFVFLMEVWATLNETHATVREIRDIRTQMNERVRAAGGAAPVADQARKVNEELLGIEEVLIPYRANARQDLFHWPIRLNGKLVSLAGFVEQGDAPPTEQDRALYGELAAELGEQLRRLDALVAGDLAELNRLLRARNLPEISRPRPG